MIDRLGWLAAATFLLVGCAAIEPKTGGPATAGTQTIPTDTIVEKVFGLEISYVKNKDKTLTVTVNPGTLKLDKEGDLPLTLNEPIQHVHISSLGQFILLVTYSSPGCVYKINPVTGKYQCFC
jgi:hypothetical protein